MPYALDDVRREEAAKHETGGPERTEQAEDGCRIALRGAAHRQEQALQAVSEEEKQGTEQQRGNGKQVISHRPPGIRSPFGVS
ncbi:peptidoglycan/xylan/chitin deacetylase (PgdA/CDA1 family) [Sinorhizobium meliloti]